ncbi:hypothetical protein C1J05_09990 [Sulfitobacter sp. JL08]|uniref:cytochrome-c peroxidase n=1 Tax=Sulfitobacter sp. JL08 TaxID=2070369 RepID=UPI000E0B2F10|nr:cytochrome c peroxidase [Sulfitobacter sp. JL08]AXI54784.1 hypothetical protein C1J05_09990 [Sulfitobacter sp. JL08]
MKSLWPLSYRSSSAVFAVLALAATATLSILLLTYFLILRPMIALQNERQSFVQASMICAQAKQNISTSEELRGKVPDHYWGMLSRSLEVTELPCRNYQILRERLLSKGVSEHKLNELNLLASSENKFSNIDYNVGLPLNAEDQLRKAIRIFGLTALPIKKFEENPKYRLGQALFYDPIISGRIDRSCATCHQDTHATADGLSVENRASVSDQEFAEEIPERNVPDLWNRDHNSFANMLWDGRLEMIDPATREFRVPEDISTDGYENLMAVQSVLPLVKPVEMLGDPKIAIRNSKKGLPDSLTANLDLEEGLKPQEILDSIISRLVGDTGDNLYEWQKDYRNLFKAAYGLSDTGELNASHIGNALAHFIELTFQSRETPWDSYLKGNSLEISKEAKQGAVLFYGLGRCAVCHSGDLFSDFSFHAIGVPQPNQEKDLGRFYASGDPKDRYKFRTPPLRNVTLTAPFFHNGYSESLTDAIVQHLSPYRQAKAYTKTGSHLMHKGEIEAISPLVGTPNYVTETQVKLIVEFLFTLEDKTAGSLSSEPDSVPSGFFVNSGDE